MAASDFPLTEESKSEGELSCRWHSGVAMKVTKRGRPFQKELCDAFIEAMRGVQLRPHVSRNLLGISKTIPNSFTLDELAGELSRVFPQIERPMTNALCQHLLDSRYIENAKNPDNNIATDGSLFNLTSKGLHLLERAFLRDSSQIAKFTPIFASQSICSKLLHLERRGIDDEISWSHSNICTLFRRFAGTQANYYNSNPDLLDEFQRYHQRSKGVPLYLAGNDVPNGLREHCFSAVTLLEWLCDFATLAGREEAAEAGAQFVRCGLISLVSDKRKANNSAIIFTVRGSQIEGRPEIAVQGEFRCTPKAVYRLTEEGIKLANWQVTRKDNDGLQYLPRNAEAPPTPQSRSTSTSTYNPTDSASPSEQTLAKKKANPEVIWKQIMEDTHMRSLFGDFLDRNFVGENLLFWLEVESLKEKVEGTDQYGNWILPQGTQRQEFFMKLADIQHKYLGTERCIDLPFSSSTFDELVSCTTKTLAMYEGESNRDMDFGTHLDPSSKLDLPIESLLTGAQKEVFGNILGWVPQFMRTSHYIGARRSQLKSSLTHTRTTSATALRPPELVPGTHITYSQRGLEQEQEARESLKTLELVEAATPR